MDRAAKAYNSFPGEPARRDFTGIVGKRLPAIAAGLPLAMVFPLVVQLVVTTRHVASAVFFCRSSNFASQRQNRSI